MRTKFFFRPRDRSLQAFKDWVHGKSFRLDPNISSTVRLEPWIGDQQWVEYWKMFWAKADGTSRSQRSSDG